MGLEEPHDYLEANCGEVYVGPFSKLINNRTSGNVLKVAPGGV